MKRRTTIELDQELVAKAKAALGCTTTRATVEEALRRAASEGDDEARRRREAQLAYLDRLESLVDLDVLRSDEMWR